MLPHGCHHSYAANPVKTLSLFSSKWWKTCGQGWEKRQVRFSGLWPNLRKGLSPGSRNDQNQFFFSFSPLAGCLLVMLYGGWGHWVLHWSWIGGKIQPGSKTDSQTWFPIFNLYDSLQYMSTDVLVIVTAELTADRNRIVFLWDIVQNWQQTVFNSV